MNHQEKETHSKEGLPEVAQADRKKPTLFFALGLVVFAFLLFIFFHSSKNKEKSNHSLEETYSVQDSDQNQKKEKPSQLSESKKNTALSQQEIQMLQEKERQLQRRLSSPLMVVNQNGFNTKPELTSSQNMAAHVNPNTQFMNQVSAQSPEMAQATMIAAPLNYLIAQGSLIHAVLETAINSDLPGYVRAIVSEPVYAEDGSQVLIPQGSRLIGQYKSGMQQGQSRIFIVWTRAIIPGGISINLGSAGVDSLGVAGMGADSIDRHFWQSFGTAILLSIIGAGASNIGESSTDQYNASEAYRIAIANSTAQTANQIFQQNGLIPPTLYVNQGQRIMVFVARDLSFESAMRKARPKTSVF